MPFSLQRVKPVEQRRAWPIVRRNGTPAQSLAIPMQTAANHSPIVHSSRYRQAAANKGSITAHCALLNQNCLATIHLQTKVKQNPLINAQWGQTLVQ